jgi:hypothetical protein
MAIHVTYGIGGYCDPCDETHDHPLNNILSQEEVADLEPTAEETAKISAVSKLKALGLTDEEISALLGL